MDFQFLRLFLTRLGLMFFFPAQGKNDRLDIHRPEVQTFIQEVSSKHQISATELTQLLAQSVRLPAVEKLILPTAPGQARSWQAYRARFVEPVRIESGVEFWSQHQTWLQRAQAQFGVPAEIIVAILGVETIYGKHQGNFRVLDVLATLSFHFPSHAPRDRSVFFKTQLEEFLIYTHRNRLAASEIDGSFAGAIGIPQFMPSSMTQFAVDFDGDGKIDLRNSAADAIGSVGAFLVQHGWQRGLELDFPVTAKENSEPKFWLANDLQAKHNTAELSQAGFQLAAPLPQPYLLGLVDLESPDAPTEYRAGTANFFAITQYNRSFFYAAAVIDLARALRVRTGILGRVNQFPNLPK
jgi:membrane-bound lytic murein transglycosylase B